MKSRPDTIKNQYDLISISHYFYPKIGGLENVAYTILSGFAKKGKRGIAIHGAAKRYSTSINGFRTEAFKTFDLFNGTYPIFFPNFIFYVFKTILLNPQAKILIHSRHLTSSLITAIICVALGRQFTLIEHNAGPIFLENKVINSIVNWIDIHIFGLLYKWGHRIVAVSQTSRNWISKRFDVNKKDIQVIYNGFPGKKIHYSSTKKENIVVWAAKWIKVKNPQIALEAFIKSSLKYPHWKFIIIGEGNSLILPENLPENIEIIPNLLKYEDMQRLLQKSKIYVNTSLSEGLSIGILDAAAYGNIPVLSDAPSNVEIAKKIGTLETVFKRKSLISLISKIEKAIAISNDINVTNKIKAETTKTFSQINMVKNYSKLLFETSRPIKIVSIIVPVYNEQTYISKVLKRINSVDFGKLVKKELIIIDDGSTDKTLNRIRKYVQNYSGKDVLKVFRNSKNLGKSQTVVNGIKASKGDLIVVNDADMEYNPKNLKSFIEKFQKDQTVDVIYGNRFNRKNKFINPAHKIGNLFLTTVSNLFTLNKGVIVKDMETCYKMGRSTIYKSIVNDIDSKSNFGIEPELTALFSNYHYDGKKVHILNIDIDYKPRGIKQGKKMRWIENGIEAIIEIVRYNLKNTTNEMPKIDSKIKANPIYIKA